MTLSNILWRCLAILLGLAATGADGYNTLAYAYNADMPADIIAIVAVAVAALALCPALAVWSYREQNAFTGALCLVAFLIAWACSYGCSINRMGDNRMNEVHAINKDNNATLIAEEDLSAARQDLKAANAALALEAVTGKGPRWELARNQSLMAVDAVKKAKREVSTAGPFKRSQTLDKTNYLIYLLPLMAQIVSISCFLIAFGDVKQKNTPVHSSTSRSRKNTQRVIEHMIKPVASVQTPEHTEHAVFQALQALADDGEFETNYRALSDASGIATGGMNQALASLEYQGLIEYRSSKGRGTTGRILNPVYA